MQQLLTLRLEQAAVVLAMSKTRGALLSQRKDQETAIFILMRVSKWQEKQRVRGGAVGSFLTLLEKNMALEGWDLLTKHADKMVSLG